MNLMFWYPDESNDVLIIDIVYLCGIHSVVSDGCSA